MTDDMARRPNVLLLFSDQHRADAMSCEAHPDVQTPRLDRLAESGVRFTRAYCQDGVCVPSRTSMMSGLYPRTLGCLANGDRCDTLKSVFPMARAFREAGYLTAAFGKRHLPTVPYACDDGWSVHAGHLRGESFGHGYLEWLADPRDHRAFQRDWAAEFGPDFAPLAARPSALPPDKTMEAFTARRTIELIRESAGRGQPFFCWASFYRPHQPYTPLPSYLARFDTSHWGQGRRAGDGLRMPPAFRETHNLPPGLLHHFENCPAWPVERARKNEQIFRDYIACYYACLEEIDHHIGSILDALQDAGIDERTIVIYTADHGDFVGAHGMVEKAATGHNIYLDTLRVPLIIRCPGSARPEAVSDDLVELVDLYPTLLALAGIDPPQTEYELVGRPLADGGSTGRPFAVSENWSQLAVMTRKRALGIWQDPHGKQFDQRPLAANMLFDLERDPHQTQNVYDDPAYAQDRQHLTGLLRDWERQTPDDGKRSHY